MDVLWRRAASLPSSAQTSGRQSNVAPPLVTQASYSELTNGSSFQRPQCHMQLLQRCPPPSAHTRFVDEQGRTVSDLEVLNHRVPGFRSFHVEGCEFFIAEDDEGRLDVTAAAILPWDTDEPRAVDLVGQKPPSRLRYKEAIWMSKFPGDMLNYKKPERKIERIYLLGIKEDGTGLLDFDQVFRLDMKSQDIRREAVQWNTHKTNPMEHVMRIRDQDILVEDFDNIPSLDDVVAAYEDSQVDQTLNEMGEKEKEGMESATLADPIESRKDTELDENSPDDTPASDMI